MNNLEFMRFKGSSGCLYGKLYEMPHVKGDFVM